MRAFTVENASRIDDLRCVDVALPALGEGDVKVRIHAVSINNRDLLVIRGISIWRPDVRRIICSDAAGVVTEVGPGVHHLAVGDRVASVFLSDWIDGPLTDDKTTGGPGAARHEGMLAQYRVLPERSFIKIPDRMSFVHASTLPCAAVTAWNALFEQSPIRPGDRVIVIGAGGVSVFSLMFARLAGAQVIAVTRRAEHAETLRALGASHVIVAADLQAAAARIVEQALCADLVIDVVGGDIRPQCQMIRTGGRLCIVGVAEGLDIHMDLLTMPVRIDTLSVGSRRMFEKMLAAMSVNEMHPVIDRIFPFDKTIDAFHYFATSRQVGKVVIEIPFDAESEGT